MQSLPVWRNLIHLIVNDYIIAESLLTFVRMHVPLLIYVSELVIKHYCTFCFGKKIIFR